MYKSRISPSVLWSVLAALAASASVSAQSLDEVVVSAERRNTDLQSTPLAISAVNAEEIEEKGVASLEELAQFVPNLTVTPTFAYGNGVPKITMRGIGAGGFPSWGIAQDSAVGIYIDGMYYSRNPTAVLGLSEIENVEVLRGPQGTLFGRNTTGGAISYQTYKASTDALKGYGQFELGNYSERNFKGGLNIPLNDDWAVRVAVADLNRNGQINRGPLNYGGVNSRVARIALHGDINERLTTDWSAAYTDSDTVGEAQEFVAYNVPPGTSVGRQMLALSVALQHFGEAPIVANDPRIVMGEGKLPYYCTVDDGNPYTFGDRCAPYRRNDLRVVTGKFNYEVNDHIKLSSLSGFLGGHTSAMIDAVNIGTWARPLWQGFQSYQQEFQINANYERWNAVGGFVYFRESAHEGEDTYESDIRPCPNCTTDAQRAAWQQKEINNVINGVQIHRRRENYWQNTNSYAAFAQATYTILPKWDITGGLRYTYDSKYGRIEYLPNPVFEPTYKYANVAGSRHWSATDYRLSTQFRVTDDVMLYASRSKAYKAGIMNDASVEVTIGSGNPVLDWTKPEDVVSTEVGLRSEWFDKRVRLNVTYFDMVWGNRSGSTVINDENGYPHFVSINQADVSSKGYELDGAVAITRSLVWSVGASHNKARQKDNPTFVLAGNAEDNWNTGLTFSHEVGGRGTLSTALNYSWTGKVYTFNTDEGAEDRPNTTPGYEFTSARLSFMPTSGKWVAALSIQNLFDEKISYGRWSLGGFYGGNGTDPQQEMRARPRNYTASIRYNF